MLRNKKPSDRKVSKKGCVLSCETRYYVSRLSPDEVSALEFQEIIQGHWEVENCLHMVKDRDFGEDKHVLRREGLGEVWTVLTNMAVSLTQLLRNGERTLREVREKCWADPRRTAKRLGFKN